MHQNTGVADIEVDCRAAHGSVEFPTLGLTLDISGMNIPESFFVEMRPRMDQAFAAMEALEKGAIANPDENRMVGHYWLRNAALSPTPVIRQEIEETIQAVKGFAAKVHDGELLGANGRFENFLLIGIGGSALGPQFVSNALGHPRTDKLKPYFFDNTDPDGIERVLSVIGDDLGKTLCVVISKSGGTKETSNGMKEAKAAYERLGLGFEQHAVAITRKDSQLDKQAVEQRWLRRFPMWDWVGGRTSELSAVGLLPAALQGFDIDLLIAGARAADIVTRNRNLSGNPSAMLALAWFFSGNGEGQKNMVVLPYKDRLELLSKYLQQLIMESIGKELDSSGRRVNQGICVFGNKGTTDQHSYIQQIRDGIGNVFVTFIEVANSQPKAGVLVDDWLTSGNYLHGFCDGTLRAIAEKQRGCIRLRTDVVTGFTIGATIACFERTVGFYASLVGVNAYHQPGVEAGKQGAAAVVEIQKKVVEFFAAHRGVAYSSAELASDLRLKEQVATVDDACCFSAENKSSGIQRIPCLKGQVTLFRSF